MTADNVSRMPSWNAPFSVSRLAWRNVLRHRGRTAMALAAIALGVAAIIIAGGFIHDVYIQFGEAIIHSQYGHLQIYRKGYSAHGTQRPTDYLIEKPSGLVHRIQRAPGVKAVLSRLRFAGTANAGGADMPVVGEGIQSQPENQLGTFIHLVEGRLLRDDDRYAVIVGDGVGKALHVHPGARLSLNIVTREGALNSVEFDVVGVFRSHSKDFDDHAIRVPLEAAQSLLATAGINEVVVELVNTQATDRIAGALGAALANEGYEVKTWRDLADFYTKTIRLFDRQFGFLQIVLLLMIVLSVSNTINTATFERLPEFGTMLALGDRRRDVFRLIVFECLILGILGSAIGVALGALFALGISALGIPMPPPPNTDIGYVALIRIVPGVVIGALGIGTLSATLAGIVPSLKIARTMPIEALRRAL